MRRVRGTKDSNRSLGVFPVAVLGVFRYANKNIIALKRSGAVGDVSDSADRNNLRTEDVRRLGGGAENVGCPY